MRRAVARRVCRGGWRVLPRLAPGSVCARYGLAGAPTRALWLCDGDMCWWSGSLDARSPAAVYMRCGAVTKCVPLLRASCHMAPWWLVIFRAVVVPPVMMRDVVVMGKCVVIVSGAFCCLLSSAFFVAWCVVLRVGFDRAVGLSRSQPAP